MAGRGRTPSSVRGKAKQAAASDPHPGAPHGGVHPKGRRQAGALARDGNGARARESGRERVIDIQRARLLAAMVEVSAERGAGNVTVAHVVERSGVSRRTFYELFTDREDCFLAAFDDGVALARRYVLGDYDPQAGWAERCRTALTGLLTFLTYERGAGQLLVVGSLGAGASALERRGRVLAQMIAVVDEGRTESKAGAELPPLTAEGVVGGVLSILHARLAGESGGRLVDLLNPLMSMIVMSYLGPAAARRELARPVPRLRSLAGRTGGDPLRDLGMRLTYRTVRVLLSIAAAPGSSNREIGLASGVADQGQISKLLTRLQGFGLAQNTGLGPGTGAPNVWTLTERGWEVQTMVTGQGTYEGPGQRW
jgi:AcrR family transcriptional regulator